MEPQAGAIDRLLTLPREYAGAGPEITAALSAAAAIARLDQALSNHPLRHAFIYRTRLEAVRRQAAVDGALIDPWQLSATLEGLKFRVDPYLRIIERGLIFDAARTALELHQWLTDTDFDQEGEVQRAEAELARHAALLPPLLAAAQGFWTWIECGEARAPMRAAVVRFWKRHKILRMPVPLTGTAALRAGAPDSRSSWVPHFLLELEREAEEAIDLLFLLERTWFAARRSIAGRRKTSHAAKVVDILAATPVISAKTIARMLGIAVKNAIRLLDELCAAQIAIEVTHRSKRRLFGLAGLAPLREAVRPPYRPEPNRGPGRPREKIVEDAIEVDAEVPTTAPLSPLERRDFDYSALEEAMVHLDGVIRQARQALRSPYLAGVHRTTEPAEIPAAISNAAPRLGVDFL